MVQKIEYKNKQKRFNINRNEYIGRVFLNGEPLINNVSFESNGRQPFFVFIDFPLMKDLKVKVQQRSNQGYVDIILTTK